MQEVTACHSNLGPLALRPLISQGLPLSAITSVPQNLDFSRAERKKYEKN